jgi:hypothetical protein
MNEEYCRDISIKIKSAFTSKRENGEYIGGFSPYGYMKDPKNKNKLIIDDEAAEIVKMIFKLFLRGLPIFRISTMLNELGVPNPSGYKKIKGLNYKSPSYANDGLWTTSTVRYILKNRMYIGDMVQGRRERISHKIAKIRAVKQENWIIKENTHEAIIDKTTFYNIHEMLKRDTRISPVKKELGLFAGFLKCPDCGRAMVKKTPNKKVLREKYTYFACTTYMRMKKSACTRHSIRSDVLERAVFTVISTYIDLAVEMNYFIDRINQSPIKNAATAGIRNVLAAKEKEKVKIENILLDLYPDWKSNLINKEQYLALKAKHEAELKKINDVLSELRKTHEREKESIDCTNGFLQNFIQFKNIKKLSREILIALVDSIAVHEGGGIEIKFKFQDAFERAAEYITTNKDLLINAATHLIRPMNAIGGVKEVL